MAWNKPSEEKRVERKGGGGQWNVHLKGLVAALIVVIGAAIVAWVVLFGGDDVPAQRTRHKAQGTTIPDAAPAVTNRAAPAAVEVTAPKPAKREIPRKPDGSVDWTKIKPHELPSEMVASDAPAPEPAPPVFSNAADQVLAMVISTPPGQEIPPIVGLGDDLEVQFFKSLEKPIEVGEGDTPEIRALKENLIATKRQIMELIDSGKTVTQILQEHREVFNENRKDYAESQAIVDQFVAEGDVESARAYVEKANAVLEKSGAPLLQMPKTKEERIAERRARREERLRAAESRASDR